MKKYFYKHIKMISTYGGWLAYYNDGTTHFEISFSCTTKPVAYSIAKANIDYLNREEKNRWHY